MQILKPFMDTRLVQVYGVKRLIDVQINVYSLHPNNNLKYFKGN